MERVVDGDADDNGSDTEYDERHVGPEYSDEGHCEEPSEDDGHSNEEEVLDPPECEHEQQGDECHGDGDGPLAVGFDLVGIAYGDDG